MAYERIVTVGGREYRQWVESYWDPKTRQTRKRILRHLGPVRPRFPRADPTLGPTAVPMEPVHFGVLATRMMTGSLTAHQVIETIREMGAEPPREALDAAGIRFDLGEKTLELLLWTRAPSSRPGRARSVGRPGRSKASARRPSSPSTASDD
ncbi:hypothetical protein B1B_02975 [mine drainage metagenome]|uniref:Uncharacterized protein n=1 Tax=mine drainage metagenome TaxID=410659 RepID=T1CXB6_9ZZZZ